MADRPKHSRRLVIGLAGLVDEPVFIARDMEKHGFETLFFIEGTDPRRPHPRLNPMIIFAPKSLTKLIFVLVRLFLTFKPDVVEQYLSSDSTLRDVLYTLIIRLFAVEKILNCIGGEILYWPKHSIWRKLSVRLAMRHASAVIGKEPYMPEMIEKYRITDVRKYHFIPNAVEKGFYRKFEPSFKKPGIKVVLFYNSFKKWRNLDILVRAANEITAEYGHVFFLIVGARNPHELARASSQVENPEQIIVLPQNSHKEFFYTLADVFVLPADHVYANLSLLEAISLNIPAVVSDAPWAEKLVAHGSNGLIVPNGNAKALKEAILEMIL